MPRYTLADSLAVQKLCDRVGTIALLHILIDIARRQGDDWHLDLAEELEKLLEGT